MATKRAAAAAPTTANRQQRRNTAAKPAPSRATAKAAVPAKRGKAAPVEEEEDEVDAFEAGEDDDEDEEGAEDGLPESFDLSDVPDQPEFEVLPPGIYDCVIERVDYGLSKTSGNPMLTWVLKTEVEDEKGNTRDQTLWYHTTLSGNGFSRTKRTILRLDPEADLEDFRPGDCNDTYSGYECRAKVGIQPSRDDPKQKQNTVREILAVDDDELG